MILAKRQRIIHTTHGFTVIEFMVATLVFSVVMLATSQAITAISKQYQKSINVSRTQAATRRLVDTIAQTLQFSAGDTVVPLPVGNNSSAYCIGGKQIMYVTGRKVGAIGATDTLHGALVRTISSGCANIDITTTSTIANSQELLGPNLRLSKLTITGTGSERTISARVVYGDDDLLCRPSIPSGQGSCVVGASTISAAQLTDPAATDISCRSGAGSEYCAVSELTTTIRRRLN